VAKRASRGHLVPHLLRRLFWPRETIAYPAGPLVLADAYRGQITVEIARCSGCNRCARECPCDALEVARLPGGGVRVSIAHDRCASCGLCELVCPGGVIHRIPSFFPGAPSKAALAESWEREGSPKSE
jgi:formate hydrogenlyase subunit 6/NADH:ubiquinone oxidoreductase subunit I